MNLIVVVLLGLIALFSLGVIGLLGNIQRELEKLSKQIENNKVLTDVINDVIKLKK